LGRRRGDRPGDKTHQHKHPDAVLHAQSAFKRRLHFPDGRTKEVSFKAGDVMWVPRQVHIGENIGTTATEVLLVELKAGATAQPALDPARKPARKEPFR
jgi:uncharacterized RmlC-like cupin family protein